MIRLIFKRIIRLIFKLVKTQIIFFSSILILYINLKHRSFFLRVSFTLILSLLTTLSKNFTISALHEALLLLRAVLLGFVLPERCKRVFYEEVFSRICSLNAEKVLQSLQNNSNKLFFNF